MTQGATGTPDPAAGGAGAGGAARDPEAEESLSEAFWSVARRLRETSHKALAPWEITPSSFRALRVLGRHGTMRLSELSEHLHIAPRSATEVADILQSHGLAERQPDPADRRATLVRLTEHGASVLDAVLAARGTEAERVFGRLSAADRAHLARILRKLRTEDLPP